MYVDRGRGGEGIKMAVTAQQSNSRNAPAKKSVCLSHTRPRAGSSRPLTDMAIAIFLYARPWAA